MPEKPPVTNAAGIVEELHVEACSYPPQAVPIASETTGTLRDRVDVGSMSPLVRYVSIAARQ
jgi:hypothetical protein